MLRLIKNLFGKKTEENTAQSVSKKIDNLFEELSENIVLIQIGSDLAEQNLRKELCDVIDGLRIEVKDECGFIIPQIHITYNSALQENEYKIYIRGNLAKDDFLIPNTDGIRDEFYDTLKTVIYDKLSEIFTNDIVERYISITQKNNGWLIWNITNVLSVPEIKIILLDLINYGKSINDIGYVFEKIGEEILLDGSCQERCFKKYNPHVIAKQVIKQL